MLIIVLLCLATSACGTAPKVVHERPVCAPAVLSPLPAITAEELESLPAYVYWKLEERERRITDWALENEAIVLKVCAPPAAAGVPK